MASARAAHLSAYAEALARIEEIRSRIAKSPEEVTETPQQVESNGEDEDNGPDKSEEDEGSDEVVEFEEVPPPEPQLAPLIYQGPFAPLGTDGRVIETQEASRSKFCILFTKKNVIIHGVFDRSPKHEQLTWQLVQRSWRG